MPMCISMLHMQELKRALSADAAAAFDTISTPPAAAPSRSSECCKRAHGTGMSIRVYTQRTLTRTCPYLTISPALPPPPFTSSGGANSLAAVCMQVLV